MQNATFLKTLLDRARGRPSAQPLQVYLDLDSTLFTVRPRTQAILQRFTLERAAQFPRETELIKTVDVRDTDWGIRTSLKRLGLIADPAFADEIREYWKLLFFSSDYLYLDQPYIGAVDFVNALKRAGAEISYLTGRDRGRMGEGTFKSLKQHGFPLDFPDRQLLMKPSLDITDVDFKESVFKAIEGLHADVFFFENEPVILHRLLAAQFRLQMVFVDSTHSGQAEPPEKVIRISPDYRWE